MKRHFNADMGYMSQSVPFRDEDENAVRVGEQAPERRQRSDAALNRAKIIDAARRALADHEDTSIRAIAERAGVDADGGPSLPDAPSNHHAVRRQARDDADLDEEDDLMPPGQLAHAQQQAPRPHADALNKAAVPLGDQIVAEVNDCRASSSAASMSSTSWRSM